MRSKSKELKAKILDKVNEYARDNQGKTPTIYDLAGWLGVSSPTIYRYLKAMDEEGIITYSRGDIQTEYTRMFTKCFVSAMAGSSIPLGKAEQCCEMIDEVVVLPGYLVPDVRGEYFILKGCGDSMVDAGIADGDLVIVRRAAEARNGEIVAALNKDGESTLKRYVKEGSEVYLWAENKEWTEEERTYRFDPLIIQGVAVRVLKEL